MQCFMQEVVWFFLLLFAWQARLNTCCIIQQPDKNSAEYSWPPWTQQKIFITLLNGGFEVYSFSVMHNQLFAIIAKTVPEEL